MTITTFKGNLRKETRKSGIVVVLFKNRLIAYCDDDKDADYFIKFLLNKVTHNE